MVENDQDQHYLPEDDQSSDEAVSSETGDEVGRTGEVAPGISIVRGNTPRPQPFEALMAAREQVMQEPGDMHAPFPVQAPLAPPLPEEIEDDDQGQVTDSAEISPDRHLPQEFVWLFEYGLEMDSAFLNSAERLNGAAFLYGPAVLKGYALRFVQDEQSGQFFCTIAPYVQARAEVWGVLYRVPRRVTVRNSRKISLLDHVHAAGTPESLFAPLSIIVRETYHEREISCGTYALTMTALQQLRLLTPEQADSMTGLVGRIAALARKQKLPSYYLKIPSQAAPRNLVQASDDKNLIATPLPREQNTDPLPVMKGKETTSALVKAVSASSPFSRWLVALSIYLIVVLLLILTFAILQGAGFASRFLTADLHLLGVPWLVPVYGVLGGTVSCIVALGRAQHLRPPLFVIILWFVRPLIGGVLALFAYLLLSSGLFAIVDFAASHTTLFPLLGALAGLCEGRLFVRWH